MPTTVTAYDSPTGPRVRVVVSDENGNPYQETDCPADDCPVECSGGSVPGDCPVLAGLPCPLGVVP